jgi:hypothetical protein
MNAHFLLKELFVLFKSHIRPSSSVFRVLMCVFSLAVFGGLTHAQNTAQGAITINGKKTELKHAYVFPDKESMSVKARLLLTDQALTPKALTSDMARILEIREKKIQTVQFSFGDKNQLLGGKFDTPPLDNVNHSSGRLKAELTSVNEKSWKGRVFTDGEDTMFKDKVSFDFRFDASTHNSNKK